jgi:restriction system protein
MAIPDFQSMMLPALRYAADRKATVSIRELSHALAQQFQLSAEELKAQLPSGRAPQYYNRLQWAVFHLRKAELLRTPRRAHVAITERGQELLRRGVERVDLRVLGEYPEFQAFRAKSSRTDQQGEDTAVEQATDKAETPLESIEDNYRRLRRALADDLLERIKAASPVFFEQLVVELLVKMGYGGSRSDAGKALGRSGDEGIDGIIKEDRLGLAAIYLQAKRWKDKSVGRPDIQQFAGALAGRGAHKGIFLTTSRFTGDARDFVKNLSTKIALIDGEQLADLMIDHGLGVSTVATYEIRRVDSDYFDEDGE